MKICAESSGKIDALPLLADEFLILDKDEPFKILGLLWNAKTDSFQYEVTLKNRKKLTKLRILSCIAQIFDPLGLIAPVTTNGKILMQNLWILRLQWDEIFPDAIEKTWKNYYDS